jgi:iron transport multicopper oxidase
MELLGDPDQQIWLSLDFDNVEVDNQTVQRGVLGPYSYIAPIVPTLYTALTTGSDAMNPAVYGSHVNPYVIEEGQIVDIIVNNLDTGGHPMHLHGHQPQVIYRSNNSYTNTTSASFVAVPMRRDTIKVDAGGSIVLRYQANNPGVFLFHCHIEWHVEAGVSVTIIESPDKLQQSGLTIPPDHLAACQVQGIPTSGNCAGNTTDPLDTSQCATAFDADPVGAYVG